MILRSFEESHDQWKWCKKGNYNNNRVILISFRLSAISIRYVIAIRCTMQPVYVLTGHGYTLQYYIVSAIYALCCIRFQNFFFVAACMRFVHLQFQCSFHLIYLHCVNVTVFYVLLLFLFLLFFITSKCVLFAKVSNSN